MSEIECVEKIIKKVNTCQHASAIISASTIEKASARGVFLSKFTFFDPASLLLFAEDDVSSFRLSFVLLLMLIGVLGVVVVDFCF